MRKRFSDIMRSIRPARCVVVLLISAGGLFGGPSFVLAQTEDECKEILARYERGWKKAEEWAWTRISDEKIADFNGRVWAKKLDPENPKRKILDPKNPGDDEKWKQRWLSPDFLETILTEKCLRSAIPEKGVRIKGAYFKRGIKLKGESIQNRLPIERPLVIEKSFFKSGVVMSRFRASRTVSFTGSAFRKKLSMSSVEIGGDLLLKRTLFNNSVRLEDAKIGGNLDMRRSVFRGRLGMESAEIGGELLMRNAHFEVQVELTPFIIVDSRLDMRAATLVGLDLTGAQIKGELRLGPLGDKNITWKSHIDRNKKSHPPKLILRGATVGTLRDSEDAWPDVLELDDFTYKSFGKVGGSVFDNRGSWWFVEKWLAKDKTYSPQPYRHLLKLLRAAGRDGMAEQILYADREHQRRDSNTPWGRWLLLSGLWLVFGYGYGWRSFLTLLWAMLFVVIGTAVLHKTRELDRDGNRLGFWYSLDMLLPAIHLREQHYEVDLKSGVKYYFYIHKIVGYTLAFFLLAGLSGLTKYLVE